VRSDVLIIGAGSAGSVLAQRLSSDSSCLVTVVEAGPGPSDPLVSTQISDGLRLPIGTASSVVRRYPTTLTDNPERHAQIMRGAEEGDEFVVRTAAKGAKKPASSPSAPSSPRPVPGGPGFGG